MRTRLTVALFWHSIHKSLLARGGMPDVSDPIRRKYRIASPSSYAAMPLPGKEAQAFRGVPAAKFAETVPLEKFLEAVPAEARPKRRAAWIVHGMGQQVPFETLDGLAEGIMRVAHPVPGADGFAPRVRTVHIGDQTIQRVALDVFE